MIIECDQCHNKIEYDVVRPNFCSSCGSVLPPKGEEATQIQESATIVSDSPETIADGKRVATEVPDVIDGYRLGRKLGQGGMGTVWEATHIDTGRPVALKLLSTSLETNDTNVERFVREAKLAAALSHPRSTFVFGAGQHGENPYIVMELMPGDTLQTLVERKGKLAPADAVDHILDAIDGLQAAHKLGIIHRDVKPSNCFIDTLGRSKVGDFGLSKSLIGDVNLTQTGAFLGTPLFAAPEQVRGEAVDERTDIYSVGATLFYLLTGKGPFQGDSFAVIAQIVAEPPTKLSALEPDAPKALGEIIDKTLAKSPAQRYQSLEELKDALTPYSSKGFVGVDLWRRFAAYMFDLFMVSTLTAVVSTGINMFIGIQMRLNDATNAELGSHNENVAEFTPYIKLIQVAILATYLLFFEYRSGRTLGKWIFGLRVRQLNGDKPRLWQALVRVAFIPCACGLIFTEIIVQEVLGISLYSSEGMDTSSFLISVGIGMPVTLFCLGCFLTIRKSNGFRALHDLASKTHITKVPTFWGTPRKVTFPRLQLKSESEAEISYGPYLAQGTLVASESQSLLLAKDPVLERNVWIRSSISSPKETGDSGTEKSTHFHNLTRATRPHWLQSGQREESGKTEYWSAFEAVDGAPFRLAINALGKAKWSHATLWLEQLASEIAEAIEDGSVPPLLTLDQVWVDEDDQLKLLNEPIGKVDVGSSESTFEDPDPSVRAMALFKAVLDMASADQVLTPNAEKMLNELETKNASRATFIWLQDTLNQINQTPRTLDRLTRLSTLSISIGAESTIYSFGILTTGIMIGSLLGLTSGILVAVLCLLWFPIAGISSYLTGGGSAFAAAKIAVVNRRGEVVSRLRATLRYMVCWAPVIFFYILGTGILIIVLEHPELGTDPESVEKPILNEFLTLFISMLLMLPVFIITILGAIFSFYSPQRGLQDFIMGTRLTPR